MNLNMEEMLRDSIIDSFIFIFNIPMHIGGLNIPFWIILLGILFLTLIGKNFKKLRA